MLGHDEETISGVVAMLGLGSDEISELAPPQALDVLIEIECRFLEPGLGWWFERMRGGVAYWSETEPQDATALVLELCPDKECWLVPVDCADYVVFRTTPRIAARVLAVWNYSEFALIDGAIEWLFMENHHQTFYAAGEPVASRLAARLSLPGASGARFGAAAT